MAKKTIGETFDKFTGIFLFIVTAFIPLVVMQSVVKVSKYEYGIIRSSSEMSDVFSYNKAILICIMAAIILGYKFLSSVTSTDFKVEFDYKNKGFILVMVYALFCVISTLFSSYKHVAVFGVTERYEGLLVILSYITFFVVTMNYARNRKQLEFVLWGLCVSALIIGVIGLFQYFQLDFFKTDFGAKLVQGKYYSGGGLKVKFDKIYATLYNPNCVGLYSAMLFPFMSILAVTMPIKGYKKYVYIILALLAGVLVIGSGSLGGFLGIVASFTVVAIVAIIYFFSKKNYSKLNLAIAIPAAVLAVVIVAIGSGIFVKKADIIQKLNVVVSAVKNPELLTNPNFYESMNIDGNTANVVTKGGTLKLVASGENVELQLDDTTLVPASATTIEGYDNSLSRTYEVAGLKKVDLQTYEGNVYLICYDSEDNPTHFMFKNSNGNFSYLDKFGKEIVDDIPSIGFEGIERLGSSRGYIWSRSLPLVAKHIFIGDGPDTFSLVFPQNDTVGKLVAFGNPYVIVDKPHNMFLQIAIDTGLLSLIAVLALVVLYIVQTIKAIFKEDSKDMIFCLRWACLAGVIGYMAAATTTDSVVSVAPIFWVLLGMGYAINYIKPRSVN